MAVRARAFARKARKFRSICEVHREIHDLVYESGTTDAIKEILLDRVEEAYNMAKRMNNKLVEYKYNITATECHTNDHVRHNREEIYEYRRERGKGKQGELIKDKSKLKELYGTQEKGWWEKVKKDG